MEGWIKLHRKLLENPDMRKPAYRTIWIELLLRAEHGMKFEKDKWVKKTSEEMKSIIWKGQKINLKAGQLTCGMRQLSEWTGVPRGTCERVVKLFKNRGMVEEQTSNKFSLIEVINWEEYQQNEERMRNNRGTTEDTIKNDKNEKKEEYMSDADFEAFWKAYPRREKKAEAKKRFFRLPAKVLPVILQAIETQKGSDQWTKDNGKFIPHPSSWLNGARWEDEITRAPVDMAQERNRLGDFEFVAKYGEKALTNLI